MTDTHTLQTKIATATLNNKKILTVDDNLINQKVIFNILKEYEAEIIQVDSGEKAIERCHKETFDLIFLDIMMPEKDGEQTLLELKNIENILIDKSTNGGVNVLIKLDEAAGTLIIGNNTLKKI